MCEELHWESLKDLRELSSLLETTAGWTARKKLIFTFELSVSNSEKKYCFHRFIDISRRIYNILLHNEDM